MSMQAIPSRENLTETQPIIAWIDVLCPNCKEKIETVNSIAVQWMRFLDVDCRCGFKGDFEWFNPSFRALEDREVLTR